ncbi:MAG: PIN domain-containing protein [Candidatus Cloacimonadota bacterium]|nr:PIN domain-containing protein [Candidatus Cloacimonadota bacterium]
MKEKVIFDTNIVHNTDANNFLGGRVELERFLQDADIVIPETVIQEIKRQKRRKLASNKDKFLTNPFHKLIGVNEDDTKAFSIEGYIQKLIDDEDIPFETIDLKDNNVLPQIKELAIHKRAPFESGENTDKGFKDALIYFSVLEYLQEIPNKNVFVCAKDGRLKEALNNHHNIIVVETYEEFKQQSISQFFDDYFIEKVNAEIVEVEIKKEHIIEYWHNIDDNQNVLIQVEGEEYIIEVDSGEIVSSSKPVLYNSNIEQLVLSGSFETTRSTIEQLLPFVNYFSDEDILKIFNASFSNEQIKWVIDDEDVKEFIGILYKAKGELVANEVAEFLKKNFG